MLDDHTGNNWIFGFVLVAWSIFASIYTIAHLINR
jgi:hypothetical protein